MVRVNKEEYSKLEEILVSLKKSGKTRIIVE